MAVFAILISVVVDLAALSHAQTVATSENPAQNSLHAKFLRELQESDQNIRKYLRYDARLLDAEQAYLRTQLVRGRYEDPSWKLVIEQFPDAESWIEQWQAAPTLQSAFQNVKGCWSSPTILTHLGSALACVTAIDVLRWQRDVRAFFEALFRFYDGRIPGTAITQALLDSKDDVPTLVPDILSALESIRLWADPPPQDPRRIADDLMRRGWRLVSAFQMIESLERLAKEQHQSIDAFEAFREGPLGAHLDQNMVLTSLTFSSHHAIDLETFRNSPTDAVEAYTLGLIKNLAQGPMSLLDLELGVHLDDLLRDRRMNLRAVIEQELRWIHEVRKAESLGLQITGQQQESTSRDLLAFLLSPFNDAFYRVGRNASSLDRILRDAQAQDRWVRLAARVMPGNSTAGSKLDAIELHRNLTSVLHAWNRSRPGSNTLLLRDVAIPRISIADPQVLHSTWQNTKGLMRTLEHQETLGSQVSGLGKLLAVKQRNNTEMQVLTFVPRLHVEGVRHENGRLVVLRTTRHPSHSEAFLDWAFPLEIGRRHLLRKWIREMPTSIEGARIREQIQSLQARRDALNVSDHDRSEWESKINALAEQHQETTEGRYVAAMAAALRDIVDTERDRALEAHRMNQIRSFLGLPPVGIGTLERMLDVNSDGKLDDRDEAVLRISTEMAKLLE